MRFNLSEWALNNRALVLFFMVLMVFLLFKDLVNIFG